MPSYLTIKEFNATPISFSKTFDLKEEIHSFAKNPAKTAVILQPFRESTTNTKLSVALKGELFTDGIVVSDEYKTHSIGLRFENETESNQFRDSATSIFDSVFGSDKESNDWTYRDFIKKDTDIWLKLKPDESKTSYNIKSDIKLHPKKPKDAGLHSGDSITAIVDLAAYFSLHDKTYGITPKLREIIVE